MGYSTVIDSDKCDGCEECIEACTAGVIRMRGKKAVALRPDECIGCKSCVAVCPEGAIRVEETQAELSSTCAELLKDIL